MKASQTNERIGMIIAHEIGHAFDSFGAQYDESGCLKNWWTDDDAKDFAEIQKNFVEYYSHVIVVYREFLLGLSVIK